MDGPPPPFTPEQLALLPHDDRGPAASAGSGRSTLGPVGLGQLAILCDRGLGPAASIGAHRQGWFPHDEGRLDLGNLHEPKRAAAFEARG